MKEIIQSEMRSSIASWMRQNGSGTSAEDGTSNTNYEYSEPSGNMLEAKAGSFENQF